MQNKERCNDFLHVLLVIFVCNKFLYDKSWKILIFFVVVCLFVAMSLFANIVLHTSNDTGITVGLVILTVMIVFFSSDLLNIVFHHQSVVKKLDLLIQHLQLLYGKDKLKVERLRVNLIDASMGYFELMSNAYEIYPLMYDIYGEKLLREFKGIERSMKKVG